MCRYICNNIDIEEVMNLKGDARDTGRVGKGMEGVEILLIYKILKKVKRKKSKCNCI